jgi:hypothetical protein
MINPTAKTLLNWLVEKAMYETNNIELACKIARDIARKNWDKYGEKIIEKALKQNNCTSVYKFEILCDQIKKEFDKKTH